VDDVTSYIDGTANGVEAAAAPSNASAIDLSVFNWTWAHQAGEIVAW
jgi:hypothetical protein